MDVVFQTYAGMSREELLKLVKGLAVACPLSLTRRECPLWRGDETLRIQFQRLDGLSKTMLETLAIAHQRCSQKVHDLSQNSAAGRVQR